ncbi:MAG: apolipoprotein N-acyltransferase, partial [Proteobacteria bacterium]|nr:apolipoprotein N-acyltransferase [Pseudomonadota bacterium]
MPFDLDPVTWLRARGAWSRRGLAFGAGVASVLAMAPFFLWPVLFVTLGLLVLLIDEALRVAARRPAAHAAMVGWWFGFGYFLAGLFWIGEAFLVEAEKFAVLMPFAVLVMPAGLALFWAAATAGASVAWRPGWRRVLALTIALGIAEWLRGHILTGFPWNVLGYALTTPGPFMQAASVLGIYGLTLAAVPIFAMPLAIWADQRGSGHLRPAVIASLASLAVLLGLYGAGALRLALVRPGARADVRLRLVQPSIPQREKWQPEKQRDNFAKHLDLTRRNVDGVIDEAKGITLVVWPEAAMPFAPLDQPAALSALAEVIPESGKLAAGFLRIERLQAGDANAGGRSRRIFNSLGIFGAGAQPLAIYDKTHLVPFGEYLPMQSVLEAIGLEQLTRIRGGFDVGPTPRPLMKVSGLPALAPLICY